MAARIACTGSIAFDYLMTFPGYFKDHILPDRLDSISLSFLVDSMVLQRGGTAPNIAYNLALLGGHPRVVGTAGPDFKDYGIWLESHGVDTCDIKIISEKFTASFFANTDLSNAQIASFYPGAMTHAGEITLANLPGGRPELVIISPNDPGAMVTYARECVEQGIPYIYDPSQQIVRMDGADLRTGVEGALAVFVNDYEFELLQLRTGWKREDILKQTKFLVVTLGEKGSQILTGESEYFIPVVKPEKIADPTGVGDAFRGGFLTGYNLGFDWETCGRMGALAATYCLEQYGTQNHFYTPAQFVERYRANFDDRGILDQIIS